MEEMSLTDRAADAVLLTAQLHAASAMLTIYEASGNDAAVEGCKQTMRAVLSALDSHLAALREKAK